VAQLRHAMLGAERAAEGGADWRRTCSPRGSLSGAQGGNHDR
jgi:hypothetical protein